MTIHMKPDSNTVMQGKLCEAGIFKPVQPSVHLEQLLISEKINILQRNAPVSGHSIIWPWHFSNELKTELAAKGHILHLKPKEKLRDYDIRRIQLAVLIQGSVRLISSIPGLKYRLLDLYFPGETLALSRNDSDGLSPILETCLDSFIYVLSQKNFFRLCKTFPELFEFISYLKDISYLKAQRRQIVHANFTAEKRLIWFLVNVIYKMNLNTHRAIQLKLPISRIEISEYLNISPETLSRTLQTLSARGLVTATKQNILIPDYQALLTAIR